MRRYTITISLALTVLFSIGAQSDCRRKGDAPENRSGVQNNMNSDETSSNKPIPREETAGGERIKELATGSNALIDRPFIYVARTDETYRTLQKLVPGLPPAAEIDFSKSAVVAAFAGEKNTGGYRVIFEESAGQITPQVKSPPPDAIVTEALTMPYAVALVSVGEEESLSVNLQENWSRAVAGYRITGGEFEYSGGFVGKEVKFRPRGTIRILRSDEYTTLFFNLESANTAASRKTSDVASGTLNGDRLILPRLEAADLIERPHPPFIVTGRLVPEGKLTLEFRPGKRAYPVNDGFEGRGQLTAEKTD